MAKLSELENNKVYLIGADVSKSLSPEIHNAIYKYLEIDLEYEARSIKNLGELDAFYKELSKKDFYAANITYPYKHQFKDSNLIIGSDYYNFDGQGALKFLEKNYLIRDDTKVVICGTGVTAKQINKYIKSTMLSRTKSPTYDDSIELLAFADLVIDATPFPTALKHLELFNKKQVFMDVKYFNNANYFYKYKQVFQKAYDGTGMLVAQAVLSIQQICKHLNINCESFDVLYNVGMRRVNEVCNSR